MHLRWLGAALQSVLRLAYNGKCGGQDLKWSTLAIYVYDGAKRWIRSSEKDQCC